MDYHREQKAKLQRSNWRSIPLSLEYNKQLLYITTTVCSALCVSTSCGDQRNRSKDENPITFSNRTGNDIATQPTLSSSERFENAIISYFLLRMFLICAAQLNDRELW